MHDSPPRPLDAAMVPHPGHRFDWLRAGAGAVFLMIVLWVAGHRHPATELSSSKVRNLTGSPQKIETATLADQAESHSANALSQNASPPKNSDSETSSSLHLKQSDLIELSLHDPRGNLAESLSEPGLDATQRDALVFSALQAWALVDPKAAANWALKQHLLRGETALHTVLATLAARPEEAVALAHGLALVAPAQAHEIGYALISALGTGGQFAPAARYAIEAPSELRRDLLIASYHLWGQHDPERAMKEVIQISDTDQQQLALQSVLSGWSRAEPERMAEIALQFPEGEEKNSALMKAMRAWMNKDPVQAGDWILAHDTVVPLADQLFRMDRR